MNGSGAPIKATDPRIRSAIAELQSMITARYPQATYEVSQGEDPEGVYLDVVVDVDDVTEVMDVFADRLVDLQVEEGLPLYVIPVRPLERVLESLRSRKDRTHAREDWEHPRVQS